MFASAHKASDASESRRSAANPKCGHSDEMHIAMCGSALTSLRSGGDHSCNRLPESPGHSATTMETIKRIPPYPAKIETGIQGFDELSLGGLPRGRISLLKGGPGSGKTVFALQSLVGAACERGQPGIFVAFEERPQQIIANAAGFKWDLPALLKKKLFFMDANLSPDVVQSGEFDLRGMLAMLKAKKE